MAYQFKEPNPKVECFNIWVGVKDIEVLNQISEFEHISRSKLFMLHMNTRKENYERIRKKIYQKNLSGKKTLKKSKNKVRQEQDFSQCLPYFRDQESHRDVSKEQLVFL